MIYLVVKIIMNLLFIGMLGNCVIVGVFEKLGETEMKMFKFSFNTVLLSIITTISALSQTYEVPPTSSTSLHVPYISDEAMEQCVILYNKAKWLANEIESGYVNQYSQASVNAYNEKITRHASMINSFNQNCAGKQSESAYRAAQELNRRSKGVN